MPANHAVAGAGLLMGRYEVGIGLSALAVK